MNPYRHHVVMERQRFNPLFRRWSCICGLRGEWALRPAVEHPDGFTVSRTDLRRLNQRVPVLGTATDKDGGWIVLYQCGHKVSGIDAYDRARALTSHTVVECDQQGGAGLAGRTGAPTEGAENG